ncbi:MAG TPA: HEAT repeat domain-containing protein [Pyrinomonadaceae bacterium]|nr:HEAT repeat domain-containing protein [Pyrinomonadaceae bacterium]
MKNSLLLRTNRSLAAERFHSELKRALPLLAVTVVMVVGLGAAYGQNGSGLIVSRLSSRQTGSSTLVSIAANGSLLRAQTWQDTDGFHVVIPDAQLSDVKETRGIRVRSQGRSVDILLQTKPGAPVAIQPGENRLNLSVEGKLQAKGSETEPETSAGNSNANNQPGPTAVATESPVNPDPIDGRSGFASSSTPSPASLTSASPVTEASPEVNLKKAGEYSSNGELVKSAPVAPEPEEADLLKSIFSGTNVLIVLVLAIVALVIIRLVRARRRVDQGSSEVSDRADAAVAESEVMAPDQETQLEISKAPIVKAANDSGIDMDESKAAPRVTAPGSLYGAYRVDQEVGKLILGLPHRMDVLSSRGLDDRRAIESSLLKVVTAEESGAEERRRAREALEEYGFVARHCAALLRATDPFERSSAAKALGEIGSPAALPFLLEGLYDFEAIVRNQSVVSLGELRIPSAIGALLDMARKHPDVPASLVARALSACSVEGLDLFNEAGTETASTDTALTEPMANAMQSEPPESTRDLPETTDKDVFVAALAALKSSSQEDRRQAVKTLAEFPLQKSVTTLAEVAQHDADPTIRSAALGSLAAIDHQSVFPALLIGMADESREVRAAAARSLSHLSFDRSAGYVRIVETAAERILGEVADACIRAGIVTQNIDRLANSERNQAPEALALVRLLAKAGKTRPVLDAIENHQSIKVRVAAVHLLNATGNDEVTEALRHLALQKNQPEEVQTALLEAMHKQEHTRPISGLV